MFFGGTQIYTVHIKPTEPNAGEKPVFIREGFSLMAFLFAIFWMLYHRLWLEVFVVFVVIFCLNVAGKYYNVDEATIGILQLAFNIFIGFQANDLRRANLTRRGYILSDIVVSDNELRAQQRYFDRVMMA